MTWVEHDYPDAAALTAALTARLGEICANALRERGRALLSLAGGRTPLPLYRVLAAQDLEWPQVVAMPGDDRCVAHDHPACNVAALRDAFVQAADMCIESLTVADGDVAASLVHARARLRMHTQAFDAVVLGMGEDAHTASLFPGAARLTEAMAADAREDAFAIVPEPLPPEAPFARITLGLARLLRARELHLLISGQRKRDVLRAAQATLDPMRMPVSALLHAPDAVVHIHWSP